MIPDLKQLLAYVQQQQQKNIEKRERDDNVEHSVKSCQSDFSHSFHGFNGLY